jgi:hypothetical protein
MNKYENKLNRNVNGLTANPSPTNAALRETLVKEVEVLKTSENLFTSIDNVKPKDIIAVKTQVIKVLGHKQ